MRRVIATLFIFASASVGLAAVALPASAKTDGQINGSGSSWSANAVNQWIADVQSNGINVVFTGSGSAQGRKDFTNKTTDFGVSDIGYQGVDKLSGDEDTNCTNPNDPSTCRAYAYLPVVAGGTSFPYQVRVAGQLVRNIRLSGLTIAKIFTNQITNWNDPAITKDNNGHALPSLQIIPVVHSEGSGSTAQFTRYLAKEYPSIWQQYEGSPDFTEYFKRTGNQKAQNGSDGVMNFLTSKAANGAIGYDEYSYAQNKNYPVIKVENQAGYFTAPDQYNVAVALTKAKINYNKNSKDYLLQDLDNVYTDSDPRAYPLSSYSYMIIPTSSSDKVQTPQRQSLADFLFYSICNGQAEMGPIGYSPLPINLVQAGFQQIAKLKQADSKVELNNQDVQHCNNPTFIKGHPKQNHLAQIAPKPLACDKSGAGPCAADAGIVNGNPDKNGKAPPAANGSGGSNTPGTNGAGGGSTGTGGGSASGAGGSGPGTGTTAGSGGTTVDPITGQTVQNTATATADGTLIGSPTALPVSNNGGAGTLLAVLAAVELVLILAVPPVLARRLQQRKGMHS